MTMDTFLSKLTYYQFYGGRVKRSVLVCILELEAGKVAPAAVPATIVLQVEVMGDVCGVLFFNEKYS